jgi:hypothetical protein
VTSREKARRAPEEGAPGHETLDRNVRAKRTKARSRAKIDLAETRHFANKRHVRAIKKDAKRNLRRAERRNKGE